MQNNLATTNENAKLALIKLKNLLDITKMLVNNKNENIIEFEDNLTIWKDVESNLIWEIKSLENFQTQYSYDQAIQYVNYLNQIQFGGYDKWEIPKINDLESLYTKEINNALHIKKSLSKNSDWAYWSSTSINENQNYVIYYNYAEKRREFKKFKCFLRCVCKELEK